MLFTYSIQRKKPQGVFFVTKAEHDSNPKPYAYSITFSAKSLSNKDGLMGKSDPFLMIYTYGNTKGNVSSEKVFVAKTEFIKNNLSHQWQPVEISVHACEGLDGCLSISVFDHEKNGAHVCTFIDFSYSQCYLSYFVRNLLAKLIQHYVN